MASAVAPRMTGIEWISANSKYLEAETERLRLLIRRRLLWLRTHWQKSAAENRLGWAISDQEAESLLSGEDSREELDFYQSDAAAIEFSCKVDQLEAQLQQARTLMEDAGTSAPIDLLQIRFDLTAFERDVVLLCLAPELDPSFERIYAYVQDDAARKFATPHLALTLFRSASDAAARTSFAPVAPLRRRRLLRLEPSASGGFLSSPLRVEERIIHYLTGINQIDPQCAALLSHTAYLPLAACHREAAERLAGRLQTTEVSNVINLVGLPDSGRLALARAACQRAGLGLLTFNPGALPAPGPDRRETIALAEREASLLGAGLFLDVDGLKPDEAQTLLDGMGRLQVPLLIASRDRLAWEREFLPMRIQRPDSLSQTELWSEVLGDAGVTLHNDIHALVEQFDLGPGGIARTAALATSQAHLRGERDSQVTAADLWLACRQQSGPQIEQLARRVEPCYNWDDIVVPVEVLRQLHEITTQVAHRPQVYQDWGFAKKMSRGRGISALFSGASGVGKTMAAEVLARHLNLDLYRIDLAGVVSKYIGETEKNLRSVFDAAERSGSILFFDEADALFGKRSEVKDSHDRYANIEINYLLQRMEEYRGLAILATNMRGTMDAAFLRRLRFIVDFPFPDASQRTEIWRRVFPAQAPVEQLDFGALSRLEIPGGNIRNIAVNAAFLAAAEHSYITMEYVMRAARREYAKIDRLILDTEFGRFSGATLS